MGIPMDRPPCRDCGRDISDRANLAVRCVTCSKKNGMASRNKAQKKLRLKEKASVLATRVEPEYEIPGRPKEQDGKLKQIINNNKIFRGCLIIDCPQQLAHIVRGLCNTHNERYKRGLRGEKLNAPIRRRNAEKVKCAGAECSNLVSPHSEHGLCKTHRVRQRKGADVDTPIKKRKPLPACCEHPGCAKAISGSSRMCATHVTRKRGGQDMDAPVRARHRNYGQQCAHPPCEYPAIDIGYCRFHGKRKRNGIDLYKPRVVRNVGGCQWIGPSGRCGKAHLAKGFCELHWRRYKSGVDMDATKRHAKRPPGSIRTNTDGYQQIKTSDLKWVSRHRLVLSEKIGRPLKRNEEAHHLNYDRADNRPENLQLWAKSQPSGQRAIDLLRWADEIHALYGPLRELLE